jgi:predicted RNA-binding protein YlxR (DUF448 family)
MKRKCIGCGEYKEAEKLIKITKEYTSGNIVIEPDSKTFGRSVYLCYNQNCIDNSFKKNRINKALKTNAIIDKSLINGLLA